MSAKDEILRGLPDGLNVQGKNLKGILQAIGAIDDILRTQAAELKKQTVVFTADGISLDVLGANVGVVRPPVGIADEQFKELIALLSYKPKQVKPILFELLSLYYGQDYVNASVISGKEETYDMDPNDDLIVQIDENPDKIITVTFKNENFQDINNAKADEVAAVIAKTIEPFGATAFGFDDLLQNKRFIRIRTNSPGTIGHIRVLGGQAQRKLQFETKRNTAQDNTTQFTITTTSGVIRRFTFSGGTDPHLSLVFPGDYVVIGDPNFATGNRGTFTITATGADYFEVENQSGSNQVITVSDPNDIMWFQPTRADLTNIQNYATIYETNPQTLTVRLPAVVPIVRKSLKGSHHFHINSNLVPNWPGSFLYDTTQPLEAGPINTFLDETISAGSINSIISVEETADFPQTGYIVFDFGKDTQEGPVEYLSIASATQLNIDPSYQFKKGHESGISIRLLDSISGPVIDNKGSQYPVYLTSTAPARIDLEAKVRLVTAAGIIIEFIVSYPIDPLYGDEVFWYDRSDEAETTGRDQPIYDPPLPWQ